MEDRSHELIESYPDAQQTYVVNPSLKVVFSGEDEVLVLHGIRSDFQRVVNDEGKTQLLGRVLRNMQKPASLIDIVQRGIIREENIDDAQNLIDYLVEEDILVNPENSLASLYLRTLKNAPAPLTDITVGIVGAGPIGTRIAEELARMDVGGIQVLDDRSVEHPEIERRQSNIAPPLLTEGTPYVESLREHLSQRGYDGDVTLHPVSVQDEAALRRFTATSDFVIAASEVFKSSLFHAVDMVALDTGTPWMSVFLDGSEACIGPIYVPGDTCSYNEFEIQREASLSVSRADYYTYKEAMNADGIPSTFFSLPAHLSTTSGFTASAAASFIGYGESYLVGRCFRFNFEKPYVDYEEVLKLPRSPSTANTRQGYRHTFM